MAYYHGWFNKFNSDVVKFLSLSLPVAYHIFVDSLRASIRKLYWTDGDNISMANTDGTNRSVLFPNQKGPVGELAALFCDCVSDSTP